MRPVTLSDLGVPDYDIMEDYLPRGLADHLLWGAFRCFDAVTGVACGIGLDGKHYKVLLYDDTLAPDLPARLPGLMPDRFKLVEKDVACVPLVHCQLDEQAWEWETKYSHTTRSADGQTSFNEGDGTIGWIGHDPLDPNNGHGVTARHVLFAKKDADFDERLERGDWTGRSTTSFLRGRDRALPQPHPAIPFDDDEPNDYVTKGDLAIVDVGGLPAECRVAALLPCMAPKRLLAQAASASLLDIQGRIIAEELRRLTAQNVQGDDIVLENLLVGNVVRITVLNEQGERVTRELHNMVMMQLSAPRDTEDLYSPHTTGGDSGAALTMTSGGGSGGAAATVIGFLRGMLIPVSPTVEGTVNHVEAVEFDGQQHFRMFTPANYAIFNERGELKCYLLDYFQNREGYVYPLQRPPNAIQKVVASVHHLFSKIFSSS